LKQNGHLNLAFLSTYPPRECGIATFTQDLVRELKKKKELKTNVIALSDGPYSYDDDVLFDFPQQNRESYMEAAERINRSAIQLLVIEHEYGIFGGEEGEYLLDLVKRVRKPIITTLHTVLPTPNKKRHDILQELCGRSEKVVTMALNSRKILQEVYGVEPAKIEMIPHGVPSFDLPSREALKKELHLEGRTIVSTFGLISPGKGLEYGIEAIGQVAKKHPEVLYFILGQTHPVVRKRYGEAYRSSLEKRVQELGLENNVRFVNKYLTKEEIVRGLQLSDLYMTPYLGRDQAVSGTLAYAVGYGRVIVSTPYLYAKEMLADGRGLLADFEDSRSLGEAINFLIENPENKKEMEEKTLLLGKTMRWDAVASRYVKTFRKACQEVYERSAAERERLKIAE
jgi:glycosyltransferase involved in cell wall biosynthesis